MKNVRRGILLVLSVVTLLMLTACGKFDAGAYVKALMDNSFKNDSSGFVKEGLGTKKEAEKLYKEGIEEITGALIENLDLSPGLEKKYYNMFTDMYKTTNYTVGEAIEQEDGSYTVALKYRQLQIMQPALTLAMDKAALSGVTETEEIYTLLLDCLKDELRNCSYGEEKEALIRVELQKDEYTVNEEDLQNIENYLIDWMSD